jgi:hypothetical protein
MNLEQLAEQLTLLEMERVGLVDREDGCWSLTEKGFEWECLLMRLMPRESKVFEELVKNARSKVIR